MGVDDDDDDDNQVEEVTPETEAPSAVEQSNLEDNSKESGITNSHEWSGKYFAFPAVGKREM